MCMHVQVSDKRFKIICMAAMQILIADRESMLGRLSKRGTEVYQLPKQPRVARANSL